ncbi:hypothetical protein [Marinifilum sp. D737]|uniref:hypothetical protein n=1 Tax=Marinifilum sp. D737 TaxID=2969628 RepID=UPI002274FEEB|nr:hypothetical protein [Marinifilum sp. D737]MCY1633502.1 hypothetical protein [Marinifilum sp. D737]
MNKKEKLLALIPALWASLFDTVITILGQSNDYWNGNLNMANEGNPIGNFMMKNHVSGIFIVCGLWMILIGILGYYLPRKVSRIFLLFVLIAHSWGASSWISMKFGFWPIMVFILFNAILFCKIEDIISKKNRAMVI